MDLKSKFELKELELNSLLEITQAINNNLPEDLLYRIYNFTLRANLRIGKLALYVKDEEWACKVWFGTKSPFKDMPLDERFLALEEVTNIEDDDSPFGQFNTVIPVSHKDTRLAFVFLSARGTQEPQGTGPDTNFIQALSNIILVAIENKKLARRQLRQEALRRELEIASQVQQFLFPKELPHSDILYVKANYRPHHNVGGDYYDFLHLDDHQFLICIADVSGKGVPAAILMSNFQASLRTLARKTDDLKEIIADLNLQIRISANGENFITFFMAIYDKQSQSIRYVNAGHHPPALVANGKLQLLDKGTTMLGMFHPLPFVQEGTVEDVSEFLFFTFTDGLTEAFNDDEEEYGPERVYAYVETHSKDSLDDLHQGLLDEIEEFRGEIPLGDDITLLSCRVSQEGGNG